MALTLISNRPPLCAKASRHRFYRDKTNYLTLHLHISIVNNSQDSTSTLNRDSAAMAGYPGRKTPNVSQYVANLNALPSAHDVASQSEENFNIEDELAQFTNTEFLDFDAGKFLEQQAVNEYGSPRGEDQANKGTRGSDNDMGLKGLDFANADAYPFTDLNAFLPPEQPSLQTQYAATSSLYANTPTSPFTAAPYPGQKHPLSPTTNLPRSSHSHSPITNPDTETASSRLAAEEDKRRRNTAASARFRVKKKQREQALEQSAKELENKTLALEQRIGQLETENEWLRGLVVEKHGGEREDLRLRWKKGDGERKEGKGKKGVGTEEDAGKGEEV